MIWYFFIQNPPLVRLKDWFCETAGFEQRKACLLYTSGIYICLFQLVAGKFHKEIRETEQDNVGVESAHKSEEAVETSAYLVLSLIHISDADDKNAFDIEAFLSARLKLKPNEGCDVYEVDTKGA